MQKLLSSEPASKIRQLTRALKGILSLMPLVIMIVQSSVVFAVPSLAGGLGGGLSPAQQQIFDEQIGYLDAEPSCSTIGASTDTTNSPSTPTDTTGITIDNQAAQQAAQQASTGGTKVGYALYDSSGKLLANYNDTSNTYSASVDKSMLLVAYLNQVGSGSLSDYAKTNLTAMIEQSDDPSSNNVFGLLNNPSSQITAVARSAGMSNFKYDSSDARWRLGQSQITANDFAKFFSKIDTMFPASQKSFALNLLSHITPNAGLLQAGLPGTVYSKEGWKPEPDVSNPFGNEGAPWIVNQAAQFSSGGTTYGIAVTVSGTSNESSGETTIKNIVSALVTSGGQSTQSQGSSCCSGNSSITPPTTNSGATGGATLDQVKTFASEPVTSTWNISDRAVEQWFLKQAGAQATIAKYGLNSSNIGEITSAVEAANVSPVFFYLYTVNEGGGAGGFINHYGSDIPGGGPANAKNDAEYLASESKTKQDGPATGGGEPSDMPTAEAKQILDALPLGSLGVTYIQATSATTAELETLSGKTGDWSGKFGNSFSDSMQNIKTMGGDPLQGGSTISTAGCTTSGVTGAGMQKGISFALFIAKDKGYGYSEITRETGWQKYQSDPSCTSQCGSFDCSSFISAIVTVAGYFKTNPNFATGDNGTTEAAELTGVGFKKVADSAHTSAGLQPGDILLAAGHTELYIGNNQNVGAHSDENGSTPGPIIGDQTGNEISVTGFYDDNWIGVFRASN
jgi:hypothetical protein